MAICDTGIRPHSPPIRLVRCMTVLSSGHAVGSARRALPGHTFRASNLREDPAMRRRLLIMGAAGRDFHNFNVTYRSDPQVEVVAFTATQIPFINDRTYPATLAGERYPEGIPIHDESMLTQLIKEQQIDDVVFSYSDISHANVMHKASQVLADGANFVLLG